MEGSIYTLWGLVGVGRNFLDRLVRREAGEEQHDLSADSLVWAEASDV